MKGRRFFGLTAAILVLSLTLLMPFSALAANGEASRPKRLALTFDDGPHPTQTDRILDLLAKYSIHATFFVIGSNASYYPKPLRRAAEEGHEIGNHTYTHPRVTGQSTAAFTEELEKAEQIILKITGKRPVFFRPPMGVQDNVVRTVADQKGYELVLWTVDTRDWAGASAKSIEKNILKNATDGSIILCHDYIAGENHTWEALSQVIPQLLEQGYEFVTVSELLRMR